ncbi:MAG TPA: isocitrate/isopropylmalate dehydrogenase family protein [Candidatus Bathyarchaeota archaeon]|nr:isocitrate/isopropylmalate dehydrogenase family protein [Candidatus Bathyarchaeota archaeon]
MQRTYKIAVLPGDGIGPEVVDVAVKVLEAVQKVVDDLKLIFMYGEAGYNCIEKYGTNVPQKTLDMLKETHACLKGPMTTPEEPGAPPSAAVTIRKTFNLYANVRPCKSMPGVWSLKPNIDLVIVRENTEGLYSGKEYEVAPGRGVALRVVTSRASEKVARFAFKLAEKRRRYLTCVHKRNILRVTDGIFRNAIFRVAKEFPSVKVDEVHIDAMAMRLIKEPDKFDVIVTTNLYGDILSDEAAQITGGIGLAAGANMGDNYGMFEPVHGSAPKYAGKNKVNPIATILAAKMMMEYLNEYEAANHIELAVKKVLSEGKVRTYDLGGNATTQDVGNAIVDKILQEN